MSHDMSVDMLVKIEKDLQTFKNYIEELNNCKNEIKCCMLCDEYSDITEILIDYIHCLSLLNQKYTNISNLLLKINKKKQDICDHKLDKDYIDIFPEKTIPIIYCNKCFLTFDTNN